MTANLMTIATEESDSHISSRAFFWLSLLVIAGVAAFLRLYAIDRLPPGLFGDEAVEGLDALDVLAGNFGIWFHAHLGREPIYVYLVALSYSVFGITALATRLPAIVAGMLTIPATFLLTREWGRSAFVSSGRSRQIVRITLLTTALTAISFWHVQMTRDAHRDTLLPLVEAVGYWLLWRALRTGVWKTYVVAGAVLGLAIYTYSPGRFVGVFVALFFSIEAGIYFWGRTGSQTTVSSRRSVSFLVAAAFAACVVMLPLGAYFAQNPIQFSRRFDSVSVFDTDSPPAALASSVVGNLAQFVIPGAGYQSKHYNLPGKPVFDLFVAPWFLIGVGIALARWRMPAYRFLLLWFVVMLMPAFLTADMIPKGVRALGVVPGIFIFPALAMEQAVEWAEANGGRLFRSVVILIVVSLAASATWTAFDYFSAWARMPELPLAFDADMVEVSQFLQQQPSGRPVYISSQVYRPPTEMLLGRHVPTSRYTDRATLVREFDARTVLVVGANDNDAAYLFVREHAPPERLLQQLAPLTTKITEGRYYSAVQIGGIVPPEQTIDLAFNPYLRLTGYSRLVGDPRGIVLYWRVSQLPNDRQDIRTTLTYAGRQGSAVPQEERIFGYPPLEWAVGDTVVEWHVEGSPDKVTQFSIQVTRGNERWDSPFVPMR